MSGNGETIAASCWCERTEVMIPTAMVRQGQTASCGHPGCRPDCPRPQCYDAFEVTVEADRLVPVQRGDYDPAADSHPQFRTGPQRTEHPQDLLLAGGPRLCYCGCGQPRKNPKGYFLQGHDQRTLGRLIRAVRGQAQVVLIDPDTGVVLDTVSPLDYAARFNTGKKDWVTEIERRVQLAIREEPVLAEVVPIGRPSTAIEQIEEIA